MYLISKPDRSVIHEQSTEPIQCDLNPVQKLFQEVQARARVTAPVPLNATESQSVQERQRANLAT